MKRKDIKLNLIAIFDWFWCVVFALLSLLCLVGLLWSDEPSATLIGSAIVAGLFAIAYSPLVEKSPLIRGILTVVTILFMAY